MRSRMLLLLPLAALLGAAVVVLPALAASETSQLEVNENCDHYTDWPCWTAPGGEPTYQARITVAQGATVAFADKSVTPADVVWRTAPPVCSGVPASSAESNWQGSCKFETPGTYRFESSTMYPTYTDYEIVVSASGGGATTTTATTPTGKEQTPTSGSGTTPSGGGGSPASQGTSGPTPTGSLFVGGASSAVKLAGTQRGQAVHGAVDVSQAAAGGKLEVRLLAARASLASVGHGARVQVGRALRAGLHAGATSFAVALDARARHALHAHGHLALTVKLVLSSAQGLAATVTRSVTVRA